MQTQERKYDDRKITIRGNETCNLSDLSKEERDIYFAGHEDGFEEGFKCAMWLLILLGSIGFLICAVISVVN